MCVNKRWPQRVLQYALDKKIELRCGAQKPIFNLIIYRSASSSSLKNTAKNSRFKMVRIVNTAQKWIFIAKNHRHMLHTIIII